MTVPKSLGEGGLLSTSEVAEKLNVHRSTVWNWIKTGLMPSKEVSQGERVRPFHGIDPKELAKFCRLHGYEDVSQKKKGKKK